MKPLIFYLLPNLDVFRVRTKAPFSSSKLTSYEKDSLILFLLPWAFTNMFYFSRVTLIFSRPLYRLDNLRLSYWLYVFIDYLEAISDGFSFKLELFITSMHFDMILFFYRITFRFWIIYEKLLSIMRFTLICPPRSNIMLRLLLYLIAFIYSYLELLS